MTARKNTYVIVLIVIALMAGIWAGQWFKHRNSAAATAMAGTLFTPPQAIAQFSLIDTKGRPFNNASLVGHWTFLFFGFTQCTQICPPAMANLSKMYDVLLKEQEKPMPHVVLISIDPENDTLQKLGAYVRSFNPHFQGATGDKTQLDKLAASLNVLYITNVKNGSDDKTTIDHSGAIMLIDPAGKLAAVFSMPHDPVAMAKDFRTIVANSG